MGGVVETFWPYVPRTLAEGIGSAAFGFHMAAFVVYGRQVLSSRIRPNIATWLMWLFGGIVDLLTYSSIEGAHWSTSALPFADVLGVGAVCLSIAIPKLIERSRDSAINYHSPEKSDYYLVGFDCVALGVWLLGWGAAIANDISVSTTIVTFIPLWKTTYRNPGSESPTPWLLWSIGYILMLGAIIAGNSSAQFELYFLPLYYLALHLVVLVLSLRH